MTDADLIAAFVAKNGTTKIADGARATTPGEMRRAVNGETIASQRAAREDREDLARFNERRCVIDHAGREFWQNGHGEWL